MVAAFCLVLAGAVLPFLMVIGVLPSSLWLSFVAYGSSVLGLLLGLVAAAQVFADRRRQDPMDE